MADTQVFLFSSLEFEGKDGCQCAALFKLTVYSIRLVLPSWQFIMQLGVYKGIIKS
jgi:hypothetical protein